MKLWTIYNTNIKDYLVDNKGKVVTYMMRRQAKQDADDFNSMRKTSPYEVRQYRRRIA
jgi:hypothetical protein